MGKLLAKIVLTGGPCAGKTTALSRIEEDLSEKGYRVFTIAESATELIKSGVIPNGKNNLELLDFQDVILDYQLQKENIYEQIVKKLPEDVEAIIVCDRGILDNKAYIDDSEFEKIIREKGLKEVDLADRYDLIIHMVTAANGSLENYTLANNNARTETPEEAIELDRKTAEAWESTTKSHIVDNSTNFAQKLNRVMNLIYKLINPAYRIKYQKKYLIEDNEKLAKFLSKVKYVKTDIEQTYLKSDDEEFEKRLRKKTINGETSYYLTSKRNGSNGENDIITDKKLTRKQYVKLLEKNIYGVVTKIRYTFIYKNQYFNLDKFDDGTIILETNTEKIESKPLLPEEIDVIAEVTGQKEYTNEEMSKRKLAESIKTLTKDYDKNRKRGN